MLHVVAHTLTAVLYGVYGYAHHASFFRLIDIVPRLGRRASRRGVGRDCRAVQCDAPTRHTPRLSPCCRLTRHPHTEVRSRPSEFYDTTRTYILTYYIHHRTT